MGYYEGEIGSIGGGMNGFSDGWWGIILVALLFGGFGNGGFNNRGGVMDGYVLTSDFATIERKLDSVNNGLCSLGYDQLAQINGINTNIFQGTYALKDAIGGVSTQLANSTCQIVQTNNANTQRIIDYLTNEKINEQQEKINALQLKASQEAQNNYLINALRPMPIPAYPSCNPFATNGYGCASVQ